MRARRILIIDDMDANRYVLRKIIGNESDFEILEAGSGAAGLALLDAEVDLVILDINLPDMTGFELIQEAERRLGPDALPAIINISATFMSGKDKAMGLNQGARAYLTHPINPDEVKATISSLLKSSSTLKTLEQQRQVAEAQSDTLRAEKVMLERFMRSFSHDLRSPLAAAFMATGLMKKNPARRNEEMLGVLEDNLKRIDQMVANVLDISHVSVGGGIKLTGEPLQLGQLLGEAVANLRLQVPNEVLLAVRDEQHRVLWDKQAFLRILDNLVLNAAKHGARGTSIDIDQRVEGDHVVLRLSNHGSFPDEVLANLATPYFISTRSDTKGWGLGLPIVKALCESFGGEVAFSNSATHAEVCLSLPVQLAPREA
ncbi:MAG: Bacteriophytochrome [Stenotrophomonas maltophilia]|nr:MAG: Bacteriophytochrome [Stenotrophomonas maltophilia]